MELCSDYQRDIKIESALNHIKMHLSYDITLSRLLLEKPNLFNSKVITFMPPSVSTERLLNFTEGYITPVRGLPHQCFIKYLKNFLVSNENHICVFEDAITKPSQVPQKEKEVMHLFQDEVYFILHRDNLESVDISTLISHIDYLWHFVGVLTSVTETPKNILSSKNLSLDELQNFADRAQTVTVSAYDGEGYLLVQIE